MDNLLPVDADLRPFAGLQDFKVGVLLLSGAVILALWRGQERLRLALLLGVMGIVVCEATWEVLRNRLGSFLPPGFPALHAANLFCLAGSVLWMSWRVWPIPTLGCLVVATGGSLWRTVYGPHHPVDVLGGVALGLAVSLVLHQIPQRQSLADGTVRYRLDWRRAAVLLLVVVGAWRLQIIARPDNLLVAEEAQYWDWSRRLDWSYYSKPPLTSVLIRGFTELGGSTAFTIRLLPVVISLALAGVVWLLTRELGLSARGRFVTLLTMAVMPLFAAGAVTITTDTPLMLFWGLALLALWHATIRDRTLAWYGLGLALGLGMLSKYTMVFLIPSMVGWLLTCPKVRHHGRTLHPYLATGLGLLLFSPVIYWNWSHDWVTFRHVATSAGAERGFSLAPREFLRFWGGQALVTSPLVFGLLIYATWVVIRRRQLRVQDSFLLWMALPVFVIYGTKSLQDKVQANWPALAYFAWIIFAVRHLDVWDRLRRRSGQQRPLRLYLATTLSLAFLMTYALKTPDSFGEIGSRYQPASRLGDWKALAQRADQIRQSMPQPERTFIVAREYQTAALMAFYMDGQPRVFLAPDVYRRMNQYDLWPSYGDLHCWDAVHIRQGESEVLSARVAYCFENYGTPVQLVVGSQGERPRYYSITPVYGLRSELFRRDLPTTY